MVLSDNIPVCLKQLHAYYDGKESVLAHEAIAATERTRLLKKLRRERKDMAKKATDPANIILLPDFF